MQDHLEKLASDIGEAARLAGVQTDTEKLNQVLSAYSGGFSDHPVELRTTSKPLGARGLSYRFVDLDNGDRDPYRTALASGLLETDDHPVHRLLDEVRERAEILGWGVDADTQNGLEKLWPFLAHGYPVGDFTQMASLPDSARAVAPILAEHGFAHVTIVAADYHHRTCNLYFMLQDRAVPEPKNLERLCTALGLGSDAALLDYMSHGVAANVTLDWTHPGAQRFCIYVPAPTPDAVPPMPEPIPALVENVPIHADHRSFIVGPTLTPTEPYVKLEVDWSGTILPCLQRCMAVAPIAD